MKQPPQGKLSHFKNEEMHQALIENLPQKIFFKDKESVYISCNTNYAMDLNIIHEEIAGKTDYDLYPKELAEKYRADDKRVMETGEIEDIEEKYIQGGKEFFVHTVKTPVRDKKGNVTGILGIFWDVSKQKRDEEVLRRAHDELEQRMQERTAALYEAEQKFRTFANAVPAWLWLNDAEGRNQFVNEYFIEAVGKSAEEIRETGWQTLVHPADAPEYIESYLDAVRCLRAWNRRIRVRYRDGQWHWLHSYSRPWFDQDGRLLGHFGAGVDITATVEAEEALRRHNAELEDRVAERTAALRGSEQLLLADLKAMKRLQAIGALYLGKGDLQQTLDALVEAAMAITGTDMGNLQLLDPVSGDLRIMAQRGFDPAWVDFWNHAYTGKGACHTALERGDRVIVEDVTTDAIFVDTPALEVQLKAGVRAVQSTPLMSRSGKALGMFSTHFRTPHRPGEQSLRLLDLLARQTADIIERAQSEAALRENRQKLLLALHTVKMGSWYFNLESGQFEADAAGMELHGFAPGETIASLEEGNRHIHPDDALEIQRRFEHAARTWGTYENEYRVILPDGSIRWIYSLGRVPEGSSYLIGMVQDITERKKAEELVRASETNYRTLIEFASDGIFVTDPQGRYLDVNTAGCRMLGYTRDEILGLSISDIVAPAQKTQVAPELATLKAAKTMRREWQFRRKDGTLFLGEGGGTCLPDGRLLGILHDITASKKAEEARLASELRFRGIFESNIIGIIFWNYSGEILDANDVFLAMVGYTRDDLQAGRLHWNKMTPPEFSYLDQRGLEEMAARGVCTPFEKEYIRKDGTRIPILIGAGSLGKSEKMGVAFVVDITERKKAEGALLESEERYRTLFETMDEGFCVIEMLYDPAGNPADYRFLEINPAFMKQTGLTDALTKTMREMIPEHDAHWFEIYGKVARTGESIRFENPAVAMGQHYDVFAFRIGGDGSRRVGIIFNDITERKKAEEALRESEERYRNFFDSTLDGIYQVNSDGIFTLMNLAGARIFGHDSPEEIIGRNAHEYWRDPKDRDNFRAELKIQKAISSYYIRAKDKNGEPIELESSSRIIDDEKGNFLGIEGILRDITKRKQAEEKQRLYNEELRLLAKRFSDSDEEIRRKIAIELHDRIGQNLTALNINLTYMKSQLSDEARKQIEGRLTDSMSLLEGTIEQLRDITAELRPALLDEYGLISALQWHGNQFSNRTGINVLIDENDLIPSLPAVVETAIFRIVQEAVTNVSKHAMAQRVEVMFRKMEGKIEIVIKDNGIGFDAEEVRKKQSLGLVTMKERARAINGKISFISASGKGTTVTLEVPG